MLKGCEKRVVHIKNPENPLFEEAYFFLKHSENSLQMKHRTTELWKEAEKIVNQSYIKEPTTAKSDKKFFRLRFFAAGMATGAIGTVLVFFIF